MNVSDFKIVNDNSNSLGTYSNEDKIIKVNK